jgi:hypothetical protein
MLYFVPYNLNHGVCKVAMSMLSTFMLTKFKQTFIFFNYYFFKFNFFLSQSQAFSQLN